MRAGWMAAALTGAVLAAMPAGHAQESRATRLNPMIALHEQGLPVFGITHPAIAARGARRGARQAAPPPAEQPSLMAAARDTVAYQFDDFAYDSYSPATADRFLGYMAAMLANGGSMSAHAFISKVPILHGNEQEATARIVEQLNAGHAGVMLQEVESAGEIRTALAAMRFRSRGGTRPDEGLGLAAAYWGLSEEVYKQKADPWPLNPDGELVLWAIVESRKGIEHVREIAAEPGLTVLTVGAGTLGRVFTSEGPDGKPVRDTAGFDAAVDSVLAACREFKVACSYPANNPEEIEALMARGFNVFTMQRRDEAGFAAIAAGRRLSGRETEDYRR